MNEPYKCGACGGQSFIVTTDLGPYVTCERCGNSVDAPTVTEAFQLISKPPEEKPRAP